MRVVENGSLKRSVSVGLRDDTDARANIDGCTDVATGFAVGHKLIIAEMSVQERLLLCVLPVSVSHFFELRKPLFVLLRRLR